MKKYFLSLASIFLLASPAFSAGYGDAGCGLGSIVIGDQAGAVQIFAVTLNVTGMQSFGITSGTSNCDATHGLVLASKEKEVFVSKNFDNLSREMASGQGEHLATLSGMFGCPVSNFASFSQRNFEAIYASSETTPKDVLNSLKVGIAEDSALSTSCGI